MATYSSIFINKREYEKKRRFEEMRRQTEREAQKLFEKFVIREKEEERDWKLRQKKFKQVEADIAADTLKNGMTLRSGMKKPILPPREYWGGTEYGRVISYRCDEDARAYYHKNREQINEKRRQKYIADKCEYILRERRYAEYLRNLTEEDKKKRRVSRLFEAKKLAHWRTQYSTTPSRRVVVSS